MLRILTILGLVTLTACKPSYVEFHQVGTVKCYQVNGGNQSGSWENATIHYSSKEGRDTVRVYRVSRPLSQTNTANPIVVFQDYVNKSVCTIAPY